MPLRELFAADLPKTLAPLRHTARWVDADTIAGVATDHVFLRGNGTDLQMWIASQGDPLPRRIVIKYREEEGQPQFRANFTDYGGYAGAVAAGAAVGCRRRLPAGLDAGLHADGRHRRLDDLLPMRLGLVHAGIPQRRGGLPHEQSAAGLLSEQSRS